MTWQRNVHIIWVIKSNLESIYLLYDDVWWDSWAVVNANFMMTKNECSLRIFEIHLRICNILALCSFLWSLKPRHLMITRYQKLYSHYTTGKKYTCGTRVMGCNIECVSEMTWGVLQDCNVNIAHNYDYLDNVSKNWLLCTFYCRERKGNTASG